MRIKRRFSLFLVPSHRLLNLVRGYREPCGAEPAGTVLRHEHIVFEAYAAEVVVFLKFGVVDEVGEAAFLLPGFYQGRDEVDSRLIGNNIAFAEPPGHPEAAESELGGTALVGIIAHQVFAVIFHIVHVQTHIVSKTVRHE